MSTLRALPASLAVLLAACAVACGCAGLPGADDTGAAAAPAATWTSIAGAPASRPCCRTPEPARPACAAPGEVWCYVKVLGEECSHTERVLTSPGHWEWQRHRSCEVPGPDGTLTPAAPDVRRDLSAGVRPGEVWCQVWVQPTYEERTVTQTTTPARWEWRRTQECDLPAPAR